MDFFKREVNEGGGEDTKLVGAVVPTNIFHYLNLFCVVDKRSKSSILRPLIEEWHEEAIEKISNKKLITLAAEMGYESFKNRKSKKRPFQVVLNQQEKELRRKGVSEKSVKSIIDKIDSLKIKDDVQRKIERRNKEKLKKAKE